MHHCSPVNFVFRKSFCKFFLELNDRRSQSKLVPFIKFELLEHLQSNHVFFKQSLRQKNFQNFQASDIKFLNRLLNITIVPSKTKLLTNVNSFKTFLKITTKTNWRGDRNFQCGQLCSLHSNFWFYDFIEWMNMRSFTEWY